MYLIKLKGVTLKYMCVREKKLHKNKVVHENKQFPLLHSPVNNCLWAFKVFIWELKLKPEHHALVLCHQDFEL